MTAFLVAAFLGVFAVLMVAVAITVRADRIRTMELDDISPDELVNYRCAVRGHAFCHPELHDGQRVWRCEACGEAVVSGPGWMDWADGDAS